MPYNILVIRKSKEVNNLILTSNNEKVYRVYSDNKEVLNTLDYDKASNYFDSIETEHKTKGKI